MLGIRRQHHCAHVILKHGYPVKKVIIVAGLAALFVLIIKVLINWHGNVDESVNDPKSGSVAGNVAERHGVVGYDFGQKTIQPAVGTTAAASIRTVICMRDIEAFKPSPPYPLLGHFRRSTLLVVGEKDSVSGMVLVTYNPPKGAAVHALCRPADIASFPSATPLQTGSPKK